MSKQHTINSKSELPVMMSTLAFAAMPKVGAPADKNSSAAHNIYQATKEFALFITAMK